MLTIDALREYGADVDEGLARCMNNKDFYLRLVQKAADEERLPQLEAQLQAGDLAAAFETAHALKGLYANLSLTPLTKPVSEMTELLRSRKEMDYTELLSEVRTQFAKLRSLTVKYM